MTSNGSSIMIEDQTQKTTASEPHGRYTTVPPMLISRFLSKKKVGLCVLLIILIHLAIRLWGFSGIHDPDEILYSEAARQLQAGQYVGQNHYSVRYMILVPLAITQMFFGINEYTCIVTPMIYSLACLGLIYLVGNIYADQKVGLIAAALWAVFPLDIIQATELHLDVPLTMFLGLCVYALIRGERTSGRNQQMLFILAGVALGFAYLAKEVGLVLLMFLSIRALWRRVWHRGYFLIALGLLTVVGLEMAWFGILTGNPLYRVSPNVWAQHADLMHADVTSPLAWMSEYAEMLMNPLSTRSVYFTGFFILVLVGTLWGWYARDRAVMELSVWWMSILAVFNFAPLDTTFQHPLFQHYPRTIHPIFMPGLVIVAYTIAHHLASSLRIVSVLCCLLPVVLVSVWLNRLENRQFAESARQSVALAQSLPGDVAIVTDPLLIWKLRFYYEFQNKKIERLVAFDASHNPGPALWVYDPISLEYTMRYWGRPKGGPPHPPDCPMVQLGIDGVPAFARTLISASGVIVRGADRVLRRWDREPAKIFLCLGGSRSGS